MKRAGDFRFPRQEDVNNSPSRSVFVSQERQGGDQHPDGGNASGANNEGGASGNDGGVFGDMVDSDFVVSREESGVIEGEGGQSHSVDNAGGGNEVVVTEVVEEGDASEAQVLRLENPDNGTDIPVNDTMDFEGANAYFQNPQLLAGLAGGSGATS